LKTIAYQSFRDCSGLTSITIPNKVTNIGVSAFYGCTSLTSVTIPSSVTSIGSEAFYGCSSLTSVVIGDGVTTIGGSAFAFCSSLTSINIPNSVTNIVNTAFQYCSDLTSIKVEGGNSKYDSRDNCNAIIETASNKLIAGCQNTIISNSVTSIGKNAFQGCMGLTSIAIPNSVTNIGQSAFFDCNNLTSVYITDLTAWCNIKFESNNSNPFSNSHSTFHLYLNGAEIKNLIIPNDVASIGNYTFWACKGLTSVTIPNSVTSIGNETFRFCFYLTSIIIPNSVTSIGNYAFGDCDSRLDVYCFAEEIPSTGSNVFYNFQGLTKATLHVPDSSLEDYKSTSPWSEFGTIVALTQDEIDAIGDVKEEVATEKEHYDLQGRMIAKPQKGINIIRYSDGTTKKVLIK